MPEDLLVNGWLLIPGSELHERFSRSSGPGGQSVNTADSRVELSFDVEHSPALPEWARARAAERLAGRLAGGVLTVAASEQRSQLAAWTQSVSRRRWYTTKVAALAAGLTVAGLVAGFANEWLQRPFTAAGLTDSRWPWLVSIDLALTGEAVLAFALAVAIGAWLRRTLPAIGGALIGCAVLLLGAWWAVRTLTPVSHTTGPGFTVPPDGWIIQAQAGQGVPYHAASQYWPLQVTFLAILLALAAALLASGWHATRTRAV